MSDEPEFNIINMYFGMVIPVLIFHWLLEMLCQIFNNLTFVSNIIIIVICIVSLVILNKELSMWAKVN